MRVHAHRTGVPTYSLWAVVLPPTSRMSAHPLSAPPSAHECPPTLYVLHAGVFFFLRVRWCLFFFLGEEEETPLSCSQETRRIAPPTTACLTPQLTAHHMLLADGGVL